MSEFLENRSAFLYFCVEEEITFAHLSSELDTTRQPYLGTAWMGLYTPLSRTVLIGPAAASLDDVELSRQPKTASSGGGLWFDRGDVLQPTALGSAGAANIKGELEKALVEATRSYCPPGLKSRASGGKYFSNTSARKQDV